MPGSQRTETTEPISETAAEAHVHGVCFKTGPPRLLGVELEWFVHDLEDPARPVDEGRHTAAVEALRNLSLGSLLTLEPGGQLELSSLPASSISQCVESLTADLDAVRQRLREHGLGLAGHGIDPWHSPRRLLDLPRYAAMERYYDRDWPIGRVMMSSSASVQVCLDAGTEEPGPFGQQRRWLLAHLLGAVLVAAFANSPLQDGRLTGWKSTRQAVWASMDPGRNLAPAADRDPRAAWAAYAMEAPVLCIRDDTGPWAVPEALSFREWIRTGAPRPPTTADLDYHLTTLFPPVRPHGHLELRMMDAQPGPDGWTVPLAVTAALFDDANASETAYRAVKPLAETAGPSPAPCNPLWRGAARHGLDDPELRATAVTCFTAAQEALPRLGASTAVQAAVADFTERYVLRGRCPADDMLDHLSWKGPLV
ncbi:ergothioneine biosynthesis glutamate--cysteine ligase EgtA [Actinacidiphila oryziradicis]|uniref:Glutamate--cysteine ligase EgtA n=1 Tax=Actinacidiphila oryziradicis TaxID=2571141 RepID=A0A4U0SEN3_9ACTN|nr:ergothioneine biosynthesis glutamate--cysteine ligase EgtA [Actinacidiphila oryziradicis]TKA06627.1 ergothioneine biosynthesis glutamate--cysteine ligase EgtA [Actinacidiphila oryziradicis]